MGRSDKDTNDARLSREMENSNMMNMSKAELIKSNSTNTSKSQTKRDNSSKAASKEAEPQTPEQRLRI